MAAESDSGFITFSCDCGQPVRVPIETAGAKGFCKACGRKLIVPVQEQPVVESRKPEPPSYHESPHHRRDLEGSYSEEDLVTYPERPPIRKQKIPLEEMEEEQKSLIGALGNILKYPVADKQAMQIFLSGAVLFSPLMWLPIKIFRMFLCLGLIMSLFWIVAVLGIRLMYFSYLLLIIEKSAEGDHKLPDLPVFSTWEENFKDLLKVLGVSAIAFSPYLVYALGVMTQTVAGMLEAQARGETPDFGGMAGISMSLGWLTALYAIATFYMPMVLMVLVVTKSFRKAVNPVFIFRSIFRIAGEYLTAMFIIFLLLRGTLTLLAIFQDVFASEGLATVLKYVGEPIFTFYIFVVSMHIIGLLYYRNGDKLAW